MNGIHSPADHALLIVEIDDNTELILHSYMDQNDVDLCEAVRALMNLGEMASERLREASTPAGDRNENGTPTGAPENEGMKWHKAL